MKRWNTEVFKNVAVKKLEALSQVEFWESKEVQGTLSFKEKSIREILMANFRKWTLME